MMYSDPADLTSVEKTIQNILAGQKEFFLSGVTLDLSWRIAQLKKLTAALLLYESRLTAALHEDLGRSTTESYLCEIGTTLIELNEAIRRLKHWAKPERMYSGILCFPSVKTVVRNMPYGNCLLISPFNYPVYLSLGVLTACLAGGNTAVLKLSSKSPRTTEVLKQMISETFPEQYVSVIDGGHAVADLCLNQRFDKIFYTGSVPVGQHVLRKAAEHLTPVALELGGENGNWCIVRADADIKDAARKIAFFKACNSGQICININQVAVASSVAKRFIEELKNAFTTQLGSRPQENPEYCRLVDRRKYDSVSRTVEVNRNRVVYGGTGNDATLKYSPTVIYPVSPEEELVLHESFSPLLPVVPFADEEADRLLNTIAQREHGLALYLFTSDLKWANRVMATQQFGGGCINEVCIHLMVKGAPFNGTGHSGMGAYHGIRGFLEFTHPCTVLTGSTRFNLSLREHPYGGKNTWKEKILRFVEH